MGFARKIAARAAGGPIGRIAARLLPGEPAVAVLLYHRVLPERGRDPFSLVVTEKNFREQLSLVAKRYPVLPLEQALRGLEGGTLPARHVVSITFDDGYRDNRTRALPILEELGLPATLFLSTGYAGSGEPFWWDRSERARRSVPWSAIRIPGGPRAGVPSREALYRSLKAMEPEERDRCIETLGPSEPPFSPDDLPLSFEEVRSLPPRFAVGGHGHDHLSLGLAASGAAARDIGLCAETLRREVPAHVPLFAYPFGGPEDMGAEAHRALEREGFLAAFTTSPGVIRRGANKRWLPRLRVEDMPAGRLAAMLLRAFGSRRAIPG